MSELVYTTDAQGNARPSILRPLPPPPPAHRPEEVIEVELLQAEEVLAAIEADVLPPAEAALEEAREALGAVDARLAELHRRVAVAMGAEQERQRQEGYTAVQYAWTLDDQVVGGPPGWNQPKDEVQERLKEHRAVQEREWAPANKAVQERQAELYRLRTFVLPGVRTRAGQLRDELAASRAAAQAAQAAVDAPDGARALLAALRERARARLSGKP